MMSYFMFLFMMMSLCTLMSTVMTFNNFLMILVFMLLMMPFNNHLRTSFFIMMLINLMMFMFPRTWSSMSSIIFITATKLTLLVLLILIVNLIMVISSCLRPYFPWTRRITIDFTLVLNSMHGSQLFNMETTMWIRYSPTIKNHCSLWSFIIFVPGWGTYLWSSASHFLVMNSN